MATTTRSARARSSGQPMTRAASPTGTGAAAQGVHQAAPALAVGALEGRLAGRHAGRAVRRVRIGQARGQPGTAGPSRARPAVGTAAAADRRAQLHQRLVPRPRPARRDQVVGPRLGLPGPQRPPLPPGQHPAHVGVDHAHVVLERERQDRPCRVRPDPGERPQRGQVRRQPAAVALDHRCGAPVEVDRPPVVAEADPEADHVAERRRRAGRGGREPGHEGPVARDHPVDAGLLGHHLRDEHSPRIAGRSPRQRAQVVVAPGEHRRPPGLRRVFYAETVAMTTVSA